MPVSGSSPLARGTLENRMSPPGVIRLIPARAGNTKALRVEQAAETAHPRSRGEHLEVVLSHGFAPGSSPLARGTPFFDSFHDYAARLIPARAGNT